MAKPDNLENCDRIPGLRNFVNSTRGHIRQAESGPRPQAEQRRDRTREREIRRKLSEFANRYDPGRNDRGEMTENEAEVER